MIKGFDIMEEKVVDVLLCEEGDKLAEDVILDKGILLIAKSTLIDKNLKLKIFESGIRQVKVHRVLRKSKLSLNSEHYSKFEESYINCNETLKEILHDLSGGRNIDFNKLNSICDFIFQQENNYCLFDCLRN